jgi:hypothetical protein
MIRPDFILQKLPMYTGTVEVIADDQNVFDIIRGVKQIHNRYAEDYDKIANYFVGATAEDTCENIFRFLRRASFYYVEGEDLQTLRSPSAILATGKVHGIDCKNYSLFIGGILDAINRSGEQYIPFAYRFASDKLFDPTPCHVFIVAYPGTDREIWIDPIPEVTYFDQRLTYYYHTDKKYKAMSLQILSGRSNTMGDWSETGEQVLNGNWVSASISAIANIIGAGGPNPDDWEGWHADGSDARYWVLKDGTGAGDPQNEAVNIMKWIRNKGIATMLVSSAGVPAVTPQQIANKLSRVGFPAEAQQFLRDSANGSTGGIVTADGKSQAGQNKLLTYGLIGAGVLMIANQKKKVAGIDSTTMLLLGAGVVAYFALKPKSKIDIIGDIVRKYPEANNPVAMAEMEQMDITMLQGIADGSIHGS